MTSVLKNGKSDITLRAIDVAGPGMPILASIADGKGKSASYWIDRLPSDFGTALRFRKIGGLEEPYDVLAEGESYTCECKGFLAHGHCKHGEAARHLIASGNDPKPSPRPEEAEEMPGKIDAGAALWARLEALDPSAARRYRAAGGRLHDGELERAVRSAERHAANPRPLEDL